LGALTITPVPLTVTASNASRLCDEANPIFTGSISGLVSGDIITANFSTAATTGGQVGFYAIAPTLVDPDNRLGNYDVTTHLGALTIYSIGFAPLTIQQSGTNIVLMWTNSACVLTAAPAVNGP
jgi:hypothetical protein